MLWFGHSSTMVGENFEFCVSWMLKNTHNANIFNLKFGYENFTLTFPATPFKRGNPFVFSPPFKNFFPAPSGPLRPPFVTEPKFSSPPPLKRGGGANYVNKMEMIVCIHNFMPDNAIFYFSCI